MGLSAGRWRGVPLGLGLGVALLALVLAALSLQGVEAEGVAGEPGACHLSGADAALGRGPYLQSVTTDSIVVVWETNLAADGRVDYGLTADLGMSRTDPIPTAHHAITLTGLLPQTRYYYQASSGGSPMGPVSSFRTAAPAGSGMPFSFAVFGDTRSNLLAHQKVVSRIVALAPDFALHTGDMVAAGSNASQWSEFFAIERDLVRQVPLFAVLGNHEENHANYFEAFQLPNNERWYAFHYGPVHFIGLQVDGFAD